MQHAFLSVSQCLLYMLQLKVEVHAAECTAGMPDSTQTGSCPAIIALHCHLERSDGPGISRSFTEAC